MALLSDPKLAATLDRPGAGDYLAGLKLPRATLRQALAIDSDRLDETSLAMGRAVKGLPYGTMSASYKGVYTLMDWTGWSTYVRSTGDGLKLCPAVAQRSQVTQAELLELVSKRGAFSNLAQLGARMKRSGVDLRLVVSGWVWFLINLVLTFLEQRFADPQIARAEQEALLDAFGPGLVLLDRVLRRPVERKADLAARRGHLKGQVADAAAAADLLETSQKLDRGLTVERDALLSAARRFMADKAAADQAAEKAPPKKPARRQAPR